MKQVTIRNDIVEKHMPLISEFVKAKFKWVRNDTQVVNTVLLEYARMIREQLDKIEIGSNKP